MAAHCIVFIYMGVESWLLTHCRLGKCPCFLSSAVYFSKLTFARNSFRNTIRVPNRQDPDQARRFVLQVQTRIKQAINLV